MSWRGAWASDEPWLRGSGEEGISLTSDRINVSVLLRNENEVPTESENRDERDDRKVRRCVEIGLYVSLILQADDWFS